MTQMQELAAIVGRAGLVRCKWGSLKGALHEECKVHREEKDQVESKNCF
jgi:hypothetical protein